MAQDDEYGFQKSADKKVDREMPPVIAPTLQDTERFDGTATPVEPTEPVEAPLGTAARPIVPLFKKTSHSTVGLPRESRISRARISRISLIPLLVMDL